jgi:hypothetical protein
VLLESSAEVGDQLAARPAALRLALVSAYLRDGRFAPARNAVTV